MAINPITVDRLKTFVLFGHSNADGWAPVREMYSPYTHLKTVAENPIASPTEAYYKNIYALTAPQPYPGDHGTPIATSNTDSDWLELTIANTAEPGDAHPHPSPYDYPNNRGSCYPHYAYNYYERSPTIPEIEKSPGELQGVLAGVEIPFSWHWRHYWGQQVGMVKLAFSSSFLLATDAGTNPTQWLDVFGRGGLSPTDPSYVRSAIDDTYGFNAWWTPRDAFDFAPHAERFYAKWYERMQGGASKLAALGNGQKPDVQLGVFWVGDNDSAFLPTVALQASFKKTLQKLIDKFREDCVANDWTTLPAKQIPIVLMGVHPFYENSDASFDSSAFCQNAAQEIADDDDFITYVPTDGLTLLAQEGISPAIIEPTTHFGPQGYMDAADLIYEAFVNMKVDAFDALDQDETITLSQARDRVRTYYAKSRANTDLTDDIVDQHLNASMYHVLNHVGDNAYWLRRRASLAITAGPTSICTLPRYVSRLLVIHDAQDPTHHIRFEQVGFGEGGKLQIHMDERQSGTYTCSFITLPKELTRPDQIVPAPRAITEWIVVEACRRLAAASSNAPLMGHFSAEAQTLQADTMRHMGQTQRSKNDRMTTNRRRPLLGYRRYYRGTNND